RASRAAPGRAGGARAALRSGARRNRPAQGRRRAGRVAGRAGGVGGATLPGRGGPQVSDEIARCVLPDAAVRVVAVRATAPARGAVRRHAATASAGVALGRAAVSGLLLATLTKDDERVTLQLLGDGPLGPITVDATASGTVRVFVKNPAASAAAPARQRLA